MAYRIKLEIIILLVLSIFLSCKKVEEFSEIKYQSVTIKASTESEYFSNYCDDENTTKTILQPDGKVFWSRNDTISLFCRQSNNGGYPLLSQNNTETISTSFSGTMEVTDNDCEFFAIYPYNENNCFDGVSIMTTYLPSEQTACENTFEKDLFISVAHSVSTDMKFYHVCGGFKFSVEEEGIRKVTFTNLDGEPISGRLSIKFDKSDIPVVQSISDGSNSITVNAPEKGCFIPGRYYFAVVSPTKFTKGLTITYDKDSENAVFNSTKEFSIKRAVFGRAYLKDSGLKFHRSYKSIAKFNSSSILPDSVNKSSISEVYFHVNSNKTTQTKADYDVSYSPIYFEKNGNTVHLYTNAECYAVKDMKGMFSGWNSLKALDLSSFETSEVQDMSFAFENCTNLQTLVLYGLNTSNVTNMARMFYGCKSLSNLDLSDFETSNVSNTSGMFYKCNSIKTLDLRVFETKSVTDISEMFRECSNLESIDISKFETSSVTNMSNMFYGCLKIESINLSNIKTSNVTNMFKMFYNCSSLKTIDLSYVNTENVTNMEAMFCNCTNLVSIDLSSLNTSKVTTMASMFSNCTNLKDIEFGNFSTVSVTDMSNMFNKCCSLIDIDLGGFNTGNVRNMESMFKYCNNIGILDLKSFTTGSVQNMSNMFYGCKSTRILNIPYFVINNSTDIEGMFYLFAQGCGSSKIFCSKDVKNTIQTGDTAIEEIEVEIKWMTNGEQYDEDEEQLYESSDFSKDGKYIQLQKASIGSGIDIVFMGDAYSDRLISDGTYEKIMTNAMEAFFAVEPYTSMRKMFNVYMIYIVSDNETICGQTALSTSFGTGSLVSGDDDKVIKYTNQMKVIEDMDNTLITVIVNEKRYAGTTYMYYGKKGDYGEGLAIAYVPLCSSDSEFHDVLRHESGGHGFAKLADEYFYTSNGTISSFIIEQKKQKFEDGWWKNIDFTNNISNIKWNIFINDSRYSSENIGAFEGGIGYSNGVWRPTENSIMRYNEGVFNAPSREAIYYRINKLAYGDTWEYEYENFVNFDKPSKAIKAKASLKRDTAPLQYTHQPVIVDKDWREKTNK